MRVLVRPAGCCLRCWHIENEANSCGLGSTGMPLVRPRPVAALWGRTAKIKYFIGFFVCKRYHIARIRLLRVC